LNKARKTASIDFYTTHLSRNRAMRKVASYYIGPFLSELSDLLDEAGYYEKATTRLKSSDFKKLGENE